jgi:hypothetical protein
MNDECSRAFEKIRNAVSYYCRVENILHKLKRARDDANRRIWKNPTTRCPVEVEDRMAPGLHTQVFESSRRKQFQDTLAKSAGFFRYNHVVPHSSSRQLTRMSQSHKLLTKANLKKSTLAACSLLHSPIVLSWQILCRLFSLTTTPIVLLGAGSSWRQTVLISAAD